MAAAILLFCFQGAGRKLSTECRSVAGSRPSWRPIAGRAMYIRYEAPTFRPEAQPGTGRVGASVPAKPCASVTRRQHFTLRIGRASPMLAPFCPQSLVPPLRGANILPGAQPVTGRVGAPLPAKPCVSVTRRQHFALERSRTPPELALHCRQSLMPPLQGANILSWSAAGHRPSWRPVTGKALCLRYEAPTFYPEARPAAGKVRARLPAKPINSVFVRKPRC